MQTKEKLVELETGKLAKEKGFDWCVEDYYPIYRKKEINIPTQAEDYDSDMIVSRNWNNGVGSYPTKAEDVNCSAPTQSLLQKWIREVHNIHIEVQLDQTIHMKYALKIIYCDKEDETSYIEIKPDEWYLYYKFEEALEIGLKTALKFITKI